ncbi:MAG TPA: DCC1-like thiol-disulfide oxidoreductase family protein [Alphaproteobacteria bacterium]
MVRKSEAAPLLTVFYDGDGPLWRTRIGIYKLEARRAALDIAWRDIAREPDALDALGIGAGDRRHTLYAVDRDGTVYAGADALALLWTALPSHERLGHLLATPIANGLARICGRAAQGFASRRTPRAEPAAR